MLFTELLCPRKDEQRADTDQGNQSGDDPHAHRILLCEFQNRGNKPSFHPHTLLCRRVMHKAHVTERVGTNQRRWLTFPSVDIPIHRSGFFRCHGSSPTCVRPQPRHRSESRSFATNSINESMCVSVPQRRHRVVKLYSYNEPSAVSYSCSSTNATVSITNVGAAGIIPPLRHFVRSDTPIREIRTVRFVSSSPSVRLIATYTFG